MEMNQELSERLRIELGSNESKGGALTRALSFIREKNTYFYGIKLRRKYI